MSAEAWKISTFRSHGFVNKTDNMGRVYIDLPINEAKIKLRALLAETAQQPNNTGMAAEAAQIAAEIEARLADRDRFITTDLRAIMKEWARQLLHA